MNIIHVPVCEVLNNKLLWLKREPDGNYAEIPSKLFRRPQSSSYFSMFPLRRYLRLNNELFHVWRTSSTVLTLLCLKANLRDVFNPLVIWQKCHKVDCEIYKWVTVCTWDERPVVTCWRNVKHHRFVNVFPYKSDERFSV